jgi:hypothetical protein
MKNKGGTDGAGLCVFTSIEIAAHWKNVEQLRGFQEKMTHEQGGGWPENRACELSCNHPRRGGTYLRRRLLLFF